MTFFALVCCFSRTAKVRIFLAIFHFTNGDDLKNTLYHLSYLDLAVTLIPLILSLIIFWFWQANWKKALYGSFRMLAQLFIIGFFLKFIFSLDRVVPIFVVLLFMLTVAAWITLNPLTENKMRLFPFSFLSLLIVCVPTLGLIIFGIIRPTPWYRPTYLIPLSGMIFANTMNAMSIGLERLNRELDAKTPLAQAKLEAFKASVIPITNSFLAVGLVSLPGMMTGQILAGVDPLIAVRYQIMIMSTVFGTAGLGSSLFLSFLVARREYTQR